MSRNVAPCNASSGGTTGSGSLPTITLTGDTVGSGAGGSIPTTTLESHQTGAGTPSAPTDTSWLQVQPADPSVPPFKIYLHPQEFAGTWDNVLFVGWNADGAVSAPVIRQGFEQNWLTGGVNNQEWYVECYTDNSFDNHCRPFYFFQAFTGGTTGTVTTHVATHGGQLILEDTGGAGLQILVLTSTKIQWTEGIPIVSTGSGGTPATAGALRLQPQDYIAWRDATNATNVSIGFQILDSTNALDFVDPSGSIPFRFEAYPFEVFPYGGGLGAALKIAPAFVLGADQVQVGYQLNPGLLSFTFASDANANLTQAQSRSNILIVNNGVITATRQIASFFNPVAGTLIFIRNNQAAHAIAFGWNGGSTVNIPAQTSALVTSDGTNAVLLMAGT